MKSIFFSAKCIACKKIKSMQVGYVLSSYEFTLTGVHFWSLFTPLMIPVAIKFMDLHVQNSTVHHRLPNYPPAENCRPVSDNQLQ